MAPQVKMPFWSCVSTKISGNTFFLFISIASSFLLFYYALDNFRQEITGPPYEEMDGKFYVDRNGFLRTITWKDDDDYYY